MCVKLVISKNCTEMQGQKNIKLCTSFYSVLVYVLVKKKHLKYATALPTDIQFYRRQKNLRDS